MGLGQEKKILLKIEVFKTSKTKSVLYYIHLY